MKLDHEVSVHGSPRLWICRDSSTGQKLEETAVLVVDQEVDISGRGASLRETKILNVQVEKRECSGHGYAEDFQAPVLLSCQVG